MSEDIQNETISEDGTKAPVPTTSGAVTPDSDAPKKAVASVDKAGDSTKPSKKRKGDKDGGDKVAPKQEEVESDEEEVVVEEMTKMEALRSMIEHLKGLEKAEIKSLYAEMVKKEEDEDDEDEDDEEVDESTKADLLRKIAEHFKTEDEDVVKESLTALTEKKVKEEDDDDEDDSEDDESDDDVDEKVKKEEVEVDMSADIEALISGEDDLSEEFQAKAKTIFEAAVQAKVKEIQTSLEESNNESVKSLTEEVKADLVEKVDSFLSYVAEEWVKDNELAIERGLKSELTENFITGLKDLFEDHYVEVPNEKLDVVDELAGRIEDLESKLNEEVSKNIDLSTSNEEMVKNEVVRSVSSDLTETQVEKLGQLIEDLEFGDEYKSQVQTIKESYFNDSKEKVELEESIVEQNGEQNTSTEIQENLDPSMAAYTAAIGKVKPL